PPSQVCRPTISHSWCINDDCGSVLRKGGLTPSGKNSGSHAIIGLRENEVRRSPAPRHGWPVRSPIPPPMSDRPDAPGSYLRLVDDIRTGPSRPEGSSGESAL